MTVARASSPPFYINGNGVTSLSSIRDAPTPKKKSGLEARAPKNIQPPHALFLK